MLVSLYSTKNGDIYSFGAKNMPGTQWVSYLAALTVKCEKDQTPL